MSRANLNPLVEALQELYPSVPKRTCRRLVAELTSIVGKVVDEDGNLGTLRLAGRGGRRLSAVAVELRRLREAVGMTQQMAAASAGWSQAKIMRIEGGLTARVSKPDLLYLAELYEVTDETELNQLLAMLE